MFEFSFLNSGILILSLAGILPILIYLFAKKRPQKIIFSTIKFIQKSHQLQNKKLNIKNIILLLIRVLIIVLMILGVARPAVKGFLRSNSNEHPPTAVAIIIDNSYSMDYLIDSKTELELAKDISKDINQLLTQNDFCILLTRDKNWNDVNSHLGSGQFDEKKLQSINVAPNVLSIDDCLQYAEKKLSESELINSEIYFITDLQKEEITYKSKFPIYFIPTKNYNEKYNVSCQNTSHSQSLTEKNNLHKIHFELQNHSSKTVEDIIVQLFLDGRVIAEKAVTIKPFERKNDYFQTEITKTGWHSGFVKIRDERLLYDNKNYFVFNVKNEHKIAIFSKVSLPVPLASMVRIYSKKELEYLNPETTTIEELSQYDFVILYKPDLSSLRLRTLLEKSTSQKLFIADKDLTSFGINYLNDLFDVKIGDFKTNATNIEFINNYHPIGKLFDKKKVRNVKFSHYFILQNLSQKGNILGLSNGSVFCEKGNNLLLSIDLGILNNNLLYDSFYPILMYRTFEYLENSFESESQFLVGDAILTYQKGVILPSGKSIFKTNERFILEESGIYQIQNENNKLVAVNFSKEESNYKFNKNLPNFITVLDKNYKEKVLQTRYGFELWKYLLSIVLLLIILELIIIKTTEKVI